MLCTVSVGGGVGLGAIKRVQISPKPALITTQVLRASHKHQPELFVKELVCQGVCSALFDNEVLEVPEFAATGDMSPSLL